MVTTTFTISGQVLLKAGADVSTTLSGGLPAVNVGTDYVVDIWITQAESIINVMTRYNWTNGYSGYDDDVKKILEAAASSYAAIFCIFYDTTGYESRTIVEDMVNILRDDFQRSISILRDKKQQLFLSDPTTGTV